MTPTDPFVSSIETALTKPTPVRSAIKRAVMFAHGYGLPATVVAWAFRVFRLRDA